MPSGSLKLDIGEGEIQNAIAVALAEAFGPEKRDALLRDIIRSHLKYKENSYDKETILGKTVGKMIREMATDKVKLMVEEMRPEVYQIVSESLGPAFRQSVFESLKNALAGRVISLIHVSAEME